MSQAFSVQRFVAEQRTHMNWVGNGKDMQRAKTKVGCTNAPGSRQHRDRESHLPRVLISKRFATLSSIATANDLCLHPIARS